MLALDAVTAPESRETVTLHHAAEALPLGDADDVDGVAGSEHVGSDPLPGRVRRSIVRAELDQVPHRLGTCFVEVPFGRPVDVARTGLAVRELHGVIAVDISRPDLRDDARPSLEHRDRHRSRLDEDLGHPQLLADDPFDVAHVVRSPTA